MNENLMKQFEGMMTNIQNNAIKKESQHKHKRTMAEKNFDVLTGSSNNKLKYLAVNKHPMENSN
jgi:hypothetical protein